MARARWWSSAGKSLPAHAGEPNSPVGFPPSLRGPCGVLAPGRGPPIGWTGAATFLPPPQGPLESLPPLGVLTHPGHGAGGRAPHGHPWRSWPSSPGWWGPGGGGILTFLVALIPASDIAVRAMKPGGDHLPSPQAAAGAGPGPGGWDPTLPAHRRGASPPSWRAPVPSGTPWSTWKSSSWRTRTRRLQFGILGDFTDADSPEMPGDQVILDVAAEGIDRFEPDLRNRRRWPLLPPLPPSPLESRGGEVDGLGAEAGEAGGVQSLHPGGGGGLHHDPRGHAAPAGCLRYVITLDADTILPRGAALHLVGALAHPLNQAVFDPEEGRVVRGHGRCFSPEVGITLTSAHRSRFASIQSGEPGGGPLHHRRLGLLFRTSTGRGASPGRGSTTWMPSGPPPRGAFPRTPSLSHDLIEGNYARAGLITSVSVYDDFPGGGYLSYTRRKHRWIRGDWQLLPWLVGRRVRGADGVGAESPHRPLPVEDPGQPTAQPGGDRGSGLPG